MPHKYIIPLGEECYTCGSIDIKFNSLDVRVCGFPFDYVGHVFIEQIIKKLADIFSNKEKPCLLLDSIEVTGNNNEFFFKDIEHGFIYWHDTTHTCRTLFTEEDHKIFIEKYNRRYERLKTVILNETSVCILSVNHFNNIYNNIYKKEYILDLYNLLIQYNPNIMFIAVNYSNDNFTYNNLTHITIECNRDLPFADSKLQFTDKLYKRIAEVIV
jgi:hypothetical protein